MILCRQGLLIWRFSRSDSQERSGDADEPKTGPKFLTARTQAMVARCGTLIASVKSRSARNNRGSASTTCKILSKSGVLIFTALTSAANDGCCGTNSVVVPVGSVNCSNITVNPFPVAKAMR
jgi:hypothetical protein